MKRSILFLAWIYFTISSCTKEKTDYEAEIATVVPENTGFKETTSLNSDHYTVSIESLNGTLYKGYNEIHVKFKDNTTGKSIIPDNASFLPIAQIKGGNLATCPHQYDVKFLSDSNYFSGYSVFSSTSDDASIWTLYLRFTIGNKVYQISKAIDVKAQPNKNLNMTAFSDADGNQFIIALVAPQKPKVAENNLVAGIYKLNKTSAAILGGFPDSTQFSFNSVKGYTLELDPRMPEPSMGNHSSPNNKELTEGNDAFYHGVVNYTMTGNWTLNFILLNDKGKVIKGTRVPADRTPGVDGVKSDLHIDILF